jgi:hypothetical protein
MTQTALARALTSAGPLKSAMTSTAGQASDALPVSAVPPNPSQLGALGNPGAADLNGGVGFDDTTALQMLGAPPGPGAEACGEGNPCF